MMETITFFKKGFVFSLKKWVLLIYWLRQSQTEPPKIIQSQQESPKSQPGTARANQTQARANENLI